MNRLCYFNNWNLKFLEIKNVEQVLLSSTQKLEICKGMDGVQKILVVVVVALTALIGIVGVQVMLILVDLRKGIKRLNNILEDSILGGGLIRPEKLTGILEFFKKGRKVNKMGNLQETSVDEYKKEEK